MMKIWKLYILFIYIYIYTITQIFVKRFFEFPYRLSRLTVHRAYIYMKNPIPSIKSFIYLYRDYSKISNDNISKFLSKSTSPPPPHSTGVTDYPRFEQRIGSVGQQTVVLSIHREFTYTTSAERTGLFFGSWLPVRSINRTGM